VVTEEGIAYLYKAQNLEERKQALATVAGVTELGRESNVELRDKLRKAGVIAIPEDLKIKRTDAKRSLLAARSIDDLVDWSSGLYEPPAKFQSW
jgi:malonate decarboxylase alpha subunit